MSDTVKPYVDLDQVSGRETTGHEWDEIRELNNPLPLLARPALRDDRMVDPLLGSLCRLAAGLGLHGASSATRNGPR